MSKRAWHFGSRRRVSKYILRFLFFFFLWNNLDLEICRFLKSILHRYQDLHFTSSKLAQTIIILYEILGNIEDSLLSFGRKDGHRLHQIVFRDINSSTYLAEYLFIPELEISISKAMISFTQYHL